MVDTKQIHTKQIQRADGSKGTAHALSLTGRSELDGLDILTWPSYSPIWPDLDNTVRAEWFDLANSFRYVASGLYFCVPDSKDHH